MTDSWLVDGPTFRSCSACWAAMDAGPCPNGHQDPAHEWQAETGAFVVKHPAVGKPIIGRFAYPVDARKLYRWVIRTRQSFAKLLVDPTSSRVQWYVVPAEEPPESLLATLLPGKS